MGKLVIEHNIINLINQLTTTKNAFIMNNLN